MFLDEVCLGLYRTEFLNLGFWDLELFSASWNLADLVVGYILSAQC